MSAQWDQAAALRRVDGDAELLGELIEIFFHDYPLQLELLLQAAGRQDYAALRRTSHTLKGSLGYLAAAEAEQIAKQLDGVADDADSSAVMKLVYELASQVEALRDVMKSPEGEARAASHD